MLGGHVHREEMFGEKTCRRKTNAWKCSDEWLHKYPEKWFDKWPDKRKPTTNGVNRHVLFGHWIWARENRENRGWVTSKSELSWTEWRMRPTCNGHHVDNHPALPPTGLVHVVKGQLTAAYSGPLMDRHHKVTSSVVFSFFCKKSYTLWEELRT